MACPAARGHSDPPDPGSCAGNAANACRTDTGARPRKTSPGGRTFIAHGRNHARRRPSDRDHCHHAGSPTTQCRIPACSADRRIFAYCRPAEETGGDQPDRLVLCFLPVREDLRVSQRLLSGRLRIRWHGCRVPRASSVKCRSLFRIRSGNEASGSLVALCYAGEVRGELGWLELRQCAH
jgi:hypothetical protein